MEDNRDSLESPEPGRLEKIRRGLGMGTYHVVGFEDRSQAEQRMIVVMHERGSAAFNIARSAETTFKHYSRPEESPQSIEP